MCGRSSLTKTEKEIEKRFNATFYSEDLERYNPLPNYNVAPSHIHPVITNDDPEKISPFRWGLIPFWAKDEKVGYKMINARSETVLEKNSFKKPMESRRCIVPFDGFYEWKREGKTKTPYYITTTNTDIFSVAGLWEKWHSPAGDDIYSFTILTQGPNKLMENIHDRMPAILLPDQERLWLDMSLSPKEALEIISPYPSKFMKAIQVSSRVGNVRNNDATLIDTTMFIINIYLRFALIAIGIIGGTIMSSTMGFWYGFPFIFIGVILLAGYFILGTVGSAGQILQTQDFEATEKRLNLTFFPRLLYVTNRAMYYIIKGSIAGFRKDTNLAEDFFNKALALKLPTDNEKAMVLLQLSNINAAKQKWNVAKQYLRDLKKLKVTEPQLKEQVEMFDKQMSQAGQMKAHGMSVRGKRGNQMGGGKRRRPKMR